MRLKVFLAVSVFATKVCACGFSPYTPDNSYLYRILEDESIFSEYPYSTCEYFMRSFDFCDENLRLWREQTGTKMSEEKLRELIYGNNADVDMVGFNNCLEANECLEIIKNVQKIRKAMADPWYFPSNNWGCGKYSLSLESLSDACKERAKGMFRERYVLQGLRCLNSLRRWGESIEFWEQQRDSIPDNFIRTMAEREVAAAYRQAGQDSIAASIYSRVGDIASLRMCKINRGSEMEFVYEHCPDSPYFPEEIQRVIMSIEKTHMINIQNRYDWEPEDSLFAERFLKLCRRVLYERKVKNPAMWLYSAAATLDALDRPKESLSFIREGERQAKNGFLRKSFRILKMHIEAKILPINNDYENRLFKDLQWLSGEIIENMNDGEKRNLRKLTRYGQGINIYYWNDAMRRILLSDVCPRLVSAGRTTRALQLANFADYYMFKKLGNNTVKFNEWEKSDWDDFSYSSNLFEMTDSLSASQLAKYVQCQSKGNAAFDRFLASGSNLNTEYWYDIVGTHYLREHNYTEAAKWFSLLPKGYEKNTNIYRDCTDYLLRNPFDLSLKDPNSNRSRLESTSNYKLNFAKKMVLYKHDMEHGKTASIRGEAKVYYAAGLMNQMEYCWALTKYSYGWAEYLEYDENWNSYETEAYASAKAESQRLMEEGLNEIIDPELKASVLHAMNRNKEVMMNYPFTWTAHQLYLHCDTWRDYAYRTAIHRPASL